jgi:hypothetical protein
VSWVQPTDLKARDLKKLGSINIRWRAATQSEVITRSFPLYAVAALCVPYGGVRPVQCAGDFNQDMSDIIPARGVSQLMQQNTALAVT